MTTTDGPLPVSQTLKARWIFPVDRPPIENGVVAFRGNTISEVRSARPFEQATDLGDVAVLPGLVNAHAHLEFSLLSEPFEPALPFTSWIQSLIAYRRSALSPDGDAKRRALIAGWRESAGSGTTLIGEIATDSWSQSVFHGCGPNVVPFRELIGLKSDVVEQQLAMGREFLALNAERPKGLSPHAPYSVSPDLLTRSVWLAQQNSTPVAMHLAETRAELQFLDSGTGEFADMLKAFGAWPAEGLPLKRRPLNLLHALAEAPRTLVVHGNYLADDEVEFLARRPHMSVVFCPRTHDFFQHEPHPWRRLLTAGVCVALGTDGRGSNPDLSLWNEVKFLRQRFAEVSPLELLELATLAGARALGRAAECGSLTVGKRADLIVAPFADGSDKGDPQELLFQTSSNVSHTMCGGQWTHALLPNEVTK